MIYNSTAFQSLIGILEFWNRKIENCIVENSLFQSLIGILEFWNMGYLFNRSNQNEFQSLIGILEFWNFLSASYAKPKANMVSIPNRDFGVLKSNLEVKDLIASLFQSLIGILEFWNFYWLNISPAPDSMFQSLIGILEFWNWFQARKNPNWGVSIPNRDFGVLKSNRQSGDRPVPRFQSLIGILEFWNKQFQSWEREAKRLRVSIPNRDFGVLKCNDN